MDCIKIPTMQLLPNTNYTFAILRYYIIYITIDYYK